ASDLRVPMVAVSLLYRKGYFTQRLAEDGSQTEEPVEWNVADFLTEESARTSVPIENRRLELRCWKYAVKGVHGFEVPVYFLAAAPSAARISKKSAASAFSLRTRQFPPGTIVFRWSTSLVCFPSSSTFLT